MNISPPLTNTVQTEPQAADVITPLPASSVHLKGRLGDALRRSISNRLNQVDYCHLVEPFRLRSERDGFWRCEFWGKIVRSAILSWRGEPDVDLCRKIEATVAELISTRDPNGCISSYPSDLQTTDWDIWGRKYVLLGLIQYYQDIRAQPSVKEAIISQIDYLMTQIGPEARNITECGHHTGLAATSILEPIVLAYRITGEERFLRYAQWIVDQGGSTVNDIFEAVRHGVPPFALGNGKAYEMMSCFEGLAELYRTTRQHAYLESVTELYRAIRDQEIFVTGVGGLRDQWGEFWDSGTLRQTRQGVGTLGETCVTTTWVKLCGQILRLTGDSTIADEMERTLYNGVLGAMVPDGSWWIHQNPTPLAGASNKIRAGDQIPGYGEDCCVAQGPTALAMAPWLAVMRDNHGPVINLYEPAETTMTINSGECIKLTIEGDYPRCSTVSIRVTASTCASFPIRLRIPAWSRQTEVSIGHQTFGAVAGTYTTIERSWTSADTIVIRFDMNPRVIPAPDGGNRVAVMRGPIVLAQDSRLGPVDCPIHTTERTDITLKDQIPQEPLAEIYELPDGSRLCDYASAGNEFTETNQLCVWMQRSRGT